MPVPEVELFARTEVGCVRTRNEDVFVVANFGNGEYGLGPGSRLQSLSRHGTLVAICDGMGGAASGHIAAAIAAEQLALQLATESPFSDDDQLRAAMVDAVGRSNRAIARSARSHPERAGMGSTLTGCVLTHDRLHLMHVGDSRAYLRRGRTLTQLTNDDSLVSHLIAQGRLSEEDAKTFRFRNVLLQALGAQERLSLQLVETQPCSDDVLLICSDGLTGVLTDHQILEALLEHDDPVRVCRHLTELACRAGAPDNVTVAVVRFLGPDLPQARPGEDVVVVRSEYDVR